MDNRAFSKIWIIVVMAIIIGGVLTWQYWWLPSNWKIYKNEEYRFEIKYPRNCHVETMKGFLATEFHVVISNVKENVSYFDSPEGFAFIIEVFDNPNYLSAKERAKQTEAKETALKEFNINGIPAVEIGDSFKSAGGIYYSPDVYIVNDDKTKLFLIGGSAMSKNNLNMLDQISSTFRFLE